MSTFPDPTSLRPGQHVRAVVEGVVDDGIGGPWIRTADERLIRLDMSWTSLEVLLDEPTSDKPKVGEVRRSPDGTTIALKRGDWLYSWRCIGGDGYDRRDEDVADWTPLVPAVSPVPDADGLRDLIHSCAQRGIKDWDRDYDSRAAGPVTDYVMGALHYVFGRREASLRAEIERLAGMRERYREDWRAALRQVELWQALRLEPLGLEFGRPDEAYVERIRERLSDWFNVRAEKKLCVCGEPATLSTVHRADGPCYVAGDAASPRIPDDAAFQITAAIVRRLQEFGAPLTDEQCPAVTSIVIDKVRSWLSTPATDPAPAVDHAEYCAGLTWTVRHVPPGTIDPEDTDEPIRAGWWVLGVDPEDPELPVVQVWLGETLPATDPAPAAEGRQITVCGAVAEQDDSLICILPPGHEQHTEHRKRVWHKAVNERGGGMEFATPLPGYVAPKLTDLAGLFGPEDTNHLCSVHWARFLRYTDSPAEWWDESCAHCDHEKARPLFPELAAPQAPAEPEPCGQVHGGEVCTKPRVPTTNGCWGHYGPEPDPDAQYACDPAHHVAGQEPCPHCKPIPGRPQAPAEPMASCGIHTEAEAQTSIRHELCTPTEPTTWTEHDVEVLFQDDGWATAQCHTCGASIGESIEDTVNDWVDQHRADTLRPAGEEQ